MKTDTLVKWETNGISLTGRITYLNGTTAQVRANGAVYEVPKKALKIVRLKAVPAKCLNPTCQNIMTTRSRGRMPKYCCWACYVESRQHLCPTCGKRLSNHRYQHCQHCNTGENNKRNDDQVFAAIVKYQRQYTGSPPPLEYLQKEAYMSCATVKRSLRRMNEAGRIQLLGPSGHVIRGIVIPGARWVYE